MFHCFGCGEGGNVFSFVMKIDGATFPAAVRTLGEKYGIEVDQQVSPAARHQTEIRERLFAVNAQAAEFFGRTLREPAGQAAKDYLEKRGMLASTVDGFGLGYAPVGWDMTLNALTRNGSKIEDLAKAGLIVPRDQGGRQGQNGPGYYDRFRGRVMFPIRDLQKRVIGFGGRILDDGEPKYLNSPETPLFSKSRTLYGLDVARDGITQADQAVIVEGYFDAIALHQAGLANVVATLGTALTTEHIELIRRFTHNVILIFDPDAAGVRAALRTMDLFLDSGLTVQVVSLPAGDDPDTFVRREGLDALMAAIRKAPSLLEFTVEGSLKTGRQGSVEERVRCVEEVLLLLRKIKNPIEKNASIRHVADQLGLDEKVLLERYRTLGVQRSAAKNTDTGAAAAVSARLPKDEEVLLQLVLHEKCTAEMLAQLSAADFTDLRARRLVSLAHTAMEQGQTLLSVLEQAEEDAGLDTLSRALSLSELPYDDVTAAFQQSLRTLKLRRLAMEIQETKTAHAAAERAGEPETVRTLLMRSHALQQERQRLLLKGEQTALTETAGRAHG
jgi:DNA primase